LFARDHASPTFRKFGQNVSYSNTTVSRLKSGVASLAKGFVALSVAYKAAQFGKEAVQEASDLNESINAVNVSYGKNAKAVQEMGEAAATALGLSNSEFNSLAVRFSAFSKTISGGGKKTVGVLDDLTKRAADFASVMNLDVNQAAELFQSGLAGETEPLRRFGLDLSAAAVQAHAYKTGIAEAGAELTEQQKIQARYSLLMKQTGKTQGDFSKTSEQAANASRILGAQWDNLQATIGAAVLPVLAKLTTWANTTLMPFLSKAAGWVSGLGESFSGMGGKSSELSTAFQSIATAGLAVWNALKPIAIDIFNYVKENWPQIKATISEVLTQISGIITSVVALVTEIWNKWGDDLLRVAGRFWSMIGGVVKGALNVIQGIINVVTGIIKGDWGQVWEGVKQILKGAWEVLVSLVKQHLGNLLDLVKGLGGKLKEFMGWAWDKAKEAVRTGIGKLLGLVKELPGKIISALGDLVADMFSMGIDLIMGLVNGIKSMASDVADAALDTVKGAVDGAKDFLGISSPSKLMHKVGEDTGQGLANGIKAKKQAVQDAMKEITETVKSSFDASVFGQGLSSSGDMLLFAKARRNDIRTLAADVKKLMKWGLSDSLLQQLIESGDFAGVHALAQGGQRDVRQLNRIDRQTNRALNQIGNQAGNQLVDKKAIRDAVKEGTRDGMNGAKLKLDGHGNARLMIQGGGR